MNGMIKVHLDVYSFMENIHILTRSMCSSLKFNQIHSNTVLYMHTLCCWLSCFVPIDIYEIFKTLSIRTIYYYLVHIYFIDTWLELLHDIILSISPLLIIRPTLPTLVVPGFCLESKSVYHPYLSVWFLSTSYYPMIRYGPCILVSYL